MAKPIRASSTWERPPALRALGVTSTTRTEALPDVPTISEFLPGYEASGWHGVAAPRGTPGDIIGRLNNEINAWLTDPKVRAQIAATSYEGFTTSPAEFSKFIAAEVERWGKVVNFAGIKPE